MMIAKLLDSYDAAAAARKCEDSKDHDATVTFSTANATPTESTPVFTSRPPLPRVSPISYTSHAMVLQLQEYKDRVRSAFESTYRHPLAVPTASGSPRKRDSHSGNYCRARVLDSSRQLFAKGTRSAAAVSSISRSSSPRTSIQGGGVAFHRTTTSSRTAAKSSLFALGPGQYDVTPRRPATTGSIKFSPADRFPDNADGDNKDRNAPGPGQYLPNDRITAKRSARVVFSQLPRKTETKEPPRGSIAVPPATSDVVSSYYFVPSSGFASPGESTGGGIPNWSRTARFPGRRREHFQQTSTQGSPATDYIAQNKAKVESMSAGHRQQRRRVQQVAVHTQPKLKSPPSRAQRTSCVKRRNTLFCANWHAPSQETQAIAFQSSAGPANTQTLETKEAVPQAWETLIVLSVAQTKLVKLLVVATVLRRLRQAQELRYKRITFQSWTHVRDQDVMRSLAAALIARRTFRFRLDLRVERKIRAARLLRSFLSGLSVDVRFAMAVRRVQRQIISLQRWWRRARLVVRAREQCLAYKWLIVEQRLRADAVAQMPHLHRVFQPPSAPTPISSHALTKRRTSTVETPLPLHKLLNLPEQKRWFKSRFVLSPDGTLRGYTIPEPSTEVHSTDTLVVEVKNFRCHAHGFANTSLSLLHEAGLEDDGYKDCRPYLMVFRPGASRFVLITDATSLVLAPLLDWKEKLERITGYSGGSSFPGGGSQRDIADMLVQTDSSVLDDSEEIAVPIVTSSRRMSISAADGSPSSVHARRRSSRHSLRRSNVLQPLAEGEMSYYVVDLLRDCPRVPAPVVWSALREKLREERKNFRSEIYRYKLEITRYQQHERDRRQLVVHDKFKEFFTMGRPTHPHFRSLISYRKMEALVRQTIEFMKTSQPSNPKFMLPS